ncbi:unnamed protein product, partial [Nesidiocoris tenuis]
MIAVFSKKFDDLGVKTFLFQVETIGDAYCVAAGLHRESEHHACQIAWMALLMMEAAQAHHTHDGKPIM